VARICPNAACGRRYPDDAAFCGECGSITIQEQSAGDPDERLGQRLGDYVVVARVADGSMGRVYEGRHHSTRERVAIKVLHAEVARDPVAAERFRREYETARELNHPNIVRVIDFGQTADGLSYMIMEFLEGEVLSHALQREHPLPAPRIVRLICQLGTALDHAHSFGVIHRDLKPDNIFLCEGEGGDVVRILDFGSVKLQMDTGPKLTAFGTTLGSPYYMSPEQAMGRNDVDQRTDVFAAAAILYECLTGTIAFEANNVAQILMKIINQPHAPASQLRPGLPPRLDDVLDRGLAKDKARRYGSASLIAADACEAYGLEPNVAHWAQVPVDEIARALATTSPPPARAFADVAAVTEPGLRGPTLASTSGTPLRPPISGSGMLIGAALGVLFLLVLVGALLR
jgi:serine/threonine protein kinase